MAGIQDAAWAYPDPIPGRENIRNHLTFATGKGFLVKEHPRGGEPHDSAGAKTAKAAAPRRLRPSIAATGSTAASNLAAEAMNTVCLVNPPAREKDAAKPPCRFDPEALSTKFLCLDEPQRVRCHTNAGQGSQGTAFLKPPISRGDSVTLRIFCSNKPGRMRYFIGCAPACFDADAGQAVLQTKTVKLHAW